MKIFQDLFTDAEIITDCYVFTMLYEDTVAAIDSRLVVKGQLNVDVGCGSAFGGVNEEEEGGKDKDKEDKTVQKVNDLVDVFNYQIIGLNLPQWKSYFKDFFPRVISHPANQAKVADIKKGGKAFSDFVTKNFNDLTFWAPSDGDSTNSLIYSYYKTQDTPAPTFLYFLPGTKSYKL